MKPVHGSSTHVASYDPHPTKAVGVHALSEIDIVVVYVVVVEVDVDDAVIVVVM